MFIRALHSAALILITIVPVSALAADGGVDDSPFLQDKYAIWLGGFFPALDSEVRLDSSMGSPGDGLDFEDKLGLDDTKSVFFGGVRWRWPERHLLEFELIQLNRQGEVAAIGKPLNIGDYEVQLGAQINTVFDVTIGRLTYGYAVVATEKSVLNLKAGLHIAGLDTILQLSGAVFKDGVPVGDQATFIEEGGDINAPLPHFGVSYGYLIAPKVGFRAQALLFAIKFNDYKGTLLDFDVDILYQPGQRFGMGAGLRYFRTTVEDQSDDKLNGKFLYEYVGPVIYANWSF